jgi:hypothetical protein
VVVPAQRFIPEGEQKLKRPFFFLDKQFDPEIFATTRGSNIWCTSLRIE